MRQSSLAKFGIGSASKSGATKEAEKAKSQNSVVEEIEESKKPAKGKSATTEKLNSKVKPVPAAAPASSTDLKSSSDVKSPQKKKAAEDVEMKSDDEEDAGVRRTKRRK